MALVNNFGNSQAVTEAYQTSLGRAPSESEVQWWLSNSASVSDIRAGVGASAEAKAFRGEPAAPAPAPAEKASRFYGTATPQVGGNNASSEMTTASDAIARQFADVTTQMAQAGVSQEEINQFLLAEQAKADDFDRQFREQQALADAQNQAAIYADNQAFARAQSEIEEQVAAEQQRLAQQRAQYEAQIAAQQEAAAAAQREAEAQQAEIAKQIAETNRLAAEMAQRNKDEMDAMQRTSAAKIAASRKAGRTAADRSLLAGFGAAPGMPAVLGTQGGMSSGAGSLGTGGTLGVG